MLNRKIRGNKPRKFNLSNHPWISLAALWVTGIFVLIITAAGANKLGVPGNSPFRPLVTPTLAHIIVLFLIVPFVFQLPNGKSNYRNFLKAIRLIPIKPFLLLLILGITSSFVFLFLLSLNSIILRATQGFPINLTFLKHYIDLSLDLPPRSLSWVAAFPSIFEEVSWRGVMLVLFMKKYSARKSILITALGFGLFHLINLLGGVDLNFVILQVIMGSAVGFFYGYLVLRTNSLLPAMLFHFLVNMFIGSFTFYFQRYTSDGTKILYALVSYPIAVLVLIVLTKAFCKKWISEPEYFPSFDISS